MVRRDEIINCYHSIAGKLLMFLCRIRIINAIEVFVGLKLVNRDIDETATWCFHHAVTRITAFKVGVAENK
mgnify:CR=1 FL=1